MRIFPKHNLSNLTLKIFLMEFIYDFVLIYPLYVIMFSERGNLSAYQIGILLATWQIVSVAAEVPTGVIADMLSKKWALILAKGLRLIAFSTWLFIPNFWGYLLGFVLWGISDAFASGTFQAYLYESLSKENKQNFNKIYARNSSMTMLSFTIAYILSFMVGAQYEILLLASILVSLISLIICLTLPDLKIETKNNKELKPQVLQLAFKTIKDSKLLRQLLVGAVIIHSLSVVLIEYIPVYYKEVGTPVDLVPLLLAFGNAITVVLFWSMHRFEKYLVSYRLVIVLIATLLFILSFGQNTIISVFGMLLFVRLTRLIVVNNESAIQHLAVSEARATIGSIYSFSGRVIASLVIISIGFFAVSDQILLPVRLAVLLTVLAFSLTQIYYYLKKN